MAVNQEKKVPNYTGVIIGALLLPVVLLSIYLGQESLGRSICICLMALMFAVRIRWDLRRRIWFWGIIMLLLTLHIPAFLLVRWPHGWVPAVAMLPFAIADCMLCLGIIHFIEALARRNQSQ